MPRRRPTLTRRGLARSRRPRAAEPTPRNAWHSSSTTSAARVVVARSGAANVRPSDRSRGRGWLAPRPRRGTTETRSAGRRAPDDHRDYTPRPRRDDSLTARTPDSRATATGQRLGLSVAAARDLVASRAKNDRTEHDRETYRRARERFASAPGVRALAADSTLRLSRDGASGATSAASRRHVPAAWDRACASRSSRAASAGRRRASPTAVVRRADRSP